MIKFHCAGCGRKLAVPENLAGRRAKCPECGSAVLIPQAATSPPPPSVRPARREPTRHDLRVDDLPTADPPSRTSAATPVASFCPSCGARAVGSAAFCASCGASLRPGRGAVAKSGASAPARSAESDPAPPQPAASLFANWVDPGGQAQGGASASEAERLVKKIRLVSGSVAVVLLVGFIVVLLWDELAYLTGLSHSAPTYSSATDAPPGCPDMASALAVLFKGEGMLDTGRYSRDQQELIFKRDYEGKEFFVSGEIFDIGETAVTGRKYVTIKVMSMQYVDVYPADDFNIMDYAKGSKVGFVGTWTYLGTGIASNHHIERARRR